MNAELLNKLGYELRSHRNDIHIFKRLIGHNEETIKIDILAMLSLKSIRNYILDIDEDVGINYYEMQACMSYLDRYLLPGKEEYEVSLYNSQLEEDTQSSS